MGTRQSRRAVPALPPRPALFKPAPATAEDHLAHALQAHAQGRFEAAFDSYQNALAIAPKWALAYTHLGALLIAQYRLDLAISVLRFVTALEPASAVAHFNLANVLVLQDFYEEAAHHLDLAVGLAPEAYEPLASQTMVRQHFCDWAGLMASQERLRDMTYRAGAPLSPFNLLTFEASGADLLVCARTFSARFGTASDRRPAIPSPRAKSDDARIRVGFVSADFHAHATLMLMVGLIEAIDKTRFILVGYALGLDDGSDLRQRAIAAFDAFVELRGVSDADAAARIATDRIDILIDLKGHTQHARTAIFALRPAAVQVNYLGYPGTMGLDAMDYLIADDFVAPFAHAALYSEKLVHLPHCYQPNDRERHIDKGDVRRQAYGLPVEGFVFCCFNNSYKITEAVFEVWMQLLRETDRSVLWLLEPNGRVGDNLRRAAIARGVDPSRLVFAPRLPPAAHLSRLKAADLFLDTGPCNAHTTASEALWVGLPVLTCAGTSFAGRVAGSLLTAIGLPELITTSLADYKALALKLAHEPAALAGLRDRLATNRLTTPLFDTERYARGFEAALEQMVRRSDSGLEPEAFAIGDPT